MTNTPSKQTRGLDAKIDEAHRYAVTAPDVFWPHTSPGRKYGTPDGVPVRFVQGDIVTRKDLPVDDVGVRTMLEHGLIEDAPDVVAPTTGNSDDVVIVDDLGDQDDDGYVEGADTYTEG